MASPAARAVLSPRGDRLLVADAPDILLVDTKTRAVARISTPAATISDIALTPDGRTLYAAAGFGGLLAIDAVTRSVSTISRLPCPMYVALAPAGDRLYVNYQCGGPGGRRGHDAIEAIDTTTHKAVAVIKDLPNVGGHLAVSSDGAFLWADGLDACRNDIYDHAGCPAGPGSVVNIIRTADHALVRSLRVGPSDNYNLMVSRSFDAGRMVVGRRHLAVMDAATLRAAESLPGPLNGSPVYDRRASRAYVPMGKPGDIAILPIAYHPAPPPGLTARWTMDGHGGDAVAENSYVLGEDEFAPGRIGLAARLQPQRQLRLDAPPNLHIDHGEATAMAWVNIDQPVAAGQTMTILQYGAAAATGDHTWELQRRPDGRPAACLRADDDDCNEGMPALAVGSTVLAPGSWHHLALVRTGGELGLFVDGRLEATGQVPHADFNLSPRWFRVGSSETGDTPFVGRIDEIEVYSRPLSAQEIAQRMK